MAAFFRRLARGGTAPGSDTGSSTPASPATSVQPSPRRPPTSPSSSAVRRSLDSLSQASSALFSSSSGLSLEAAGNPALRRSLDPLWTAFQDEPSDEAFATLARAVSEAALEHDSDTLLSSLPDLAAFAQAISARVADGIAHAVGAADAADAPEPKICIERLIDLFGALQPAKRPVDLSPVPELHVIKCLRILSTEGASMVSHFTAVSLPSALARCACALAGLPLVFVHDDPDDERAVRTALLQGVCSVLSIVCVFHGAVQSLFDDGGLALLMDGLAAPATDDFAVQAKRRLSGVLATVADHPWAGLVDHLVSSRVLDRLLAALDNCAARDPSVVCIIADLVVAFCSIDAPNAPALQALYLDGESRGHQLLEDALCWLEDHLPSVDRMCDVISHYFELLFIGEGQLPLPQAIVGNENLASLLPKETGSGRRVQQLAVFQHLIALFLRLTHEKPRKKVLDCIHGAYKGHPHNYAILQNAPGCNLVSVVDPLDSLSPPLKSDVMCILDYVDTFVGLVPFREMNAFPIILLDDPAIETVVSVLNAVSTFIQNNANYRNHFRNAGMVNFLGDSLNSMGTRLLDAPDDRLSETCVLMAQSLHQLIEENQENATLVRELNCTQILFKLLANDTVRPIALKMLESLIWQDPQDEFGEMGHLINMYRARPASPKAVLDVLSSLNRIMSLAPPRCRATIGDLFRNASGFEALLDILGHSAALFPLSSSTVTPLSPSLSPHNAALEPPPMDATDEQQCVDAVLLRGVVRVMVAAMANSTANRAALAALAESGVLADSFAAAGLYASRLAILARFMLKLLTGGTADDPLMGASASSPRPHYLSDEQQRSIQIVNPMVARTMLDLAAAAHHDGFFLETLQGLHKLVVHNRVNQQALVSAQITSHIIKLAGDALVGDATPLQEALLALIEILGACQLSGSELKALLRLIHAPERIPLAALQSLLTITANGALPPYVEMDNVGRGFAAIEAHDVAAGRSWPPASGYSVSTWVWIESKGGPLDLFSFTSQDNRSVSECIIQDGILRLQTSPKHQYRFTMHGFQSHRWYHIVIVHHHHRFQVSSASLYVDGVFVETGKVNYVQSTSSKVALRIGRPEKIKRRQDTLVWRVGPFYFFEEPIVPSAITIMHNLGASYTGIFMGAVKVGAIRDTQGLPKINRNGEIQVPVTPDKLMLAYNAVHMDRDSEGRSVVLNVADPKGEPAGTLVGETYHQRPTRVEDTIRQLGGVSIIVRLIERSDTPETLRISMELLSNMIRNPKNAQEMLRIRGYELVALFLSRKSALMDPALLSGILSMVDLPAGYMSRTAAALAVVNANQGTRSRSSSYSQPPPPPTAAVTNLVALRHLVLDYKVWRPVPLELQHGLIEGLQPFFNPSPYRDLNLRRMRRVHIVGSLLEILGDESLPDALAPKIVGLLRSILATGITRDELESLSKFVLSTLSFGAGMVSAAAPASGARTRGATVGSVSEAGAVAMHSPTVASPSSGGLSPASLSSALRGRRTTNAPRPGSAAAAAAGSSSGEVSTQRVGIRNMLLDMIFHIISNITGEKDLTKVQQVLDNTFILALVEHGQDARTVTLAMRILCVLLLSRPTSLTKFRSDGGFIALLHLLPPFHKTVDLYTILIALALNRPKQLDAELGAEFNCVALAQHFRASDSRLHCIEALQLALAMLKKGVITLSRASPSVQEDAIRAAEAFPSPRPAPAAAADAGPSLDAGAAGGSGGGGGSGRKPALHPKRRSVSGGTPWFKAVGEFRRRGTNASSPRGSVGDQSEASAAPTAGSSGAGGSARAALSRPPSTITVASASAAMAARTCAQAGEDGAPPELVMHESVFLFLIHLLDVCADFLESCKRGELIDHVVDVLFATASVGHGADSSKARPATTSLGRASSLGQIVGSPTGRAPSLSSSGGLQSMLGGSKLRAESLGASSTASSGDSLDFASPSSTDGDAGRSSTGDLSIVIQQASPLGVTSPLSEASTGPALSADAMSPPTGTLQKTGSMGSLMADRIREVFGTQTARTIYEFLRSVAVAALHGSKGWSVLETVLDAAPSNCPGDLLAYYQRKVLSDLMEYLHINWSTFEFGPSNKTLVSNVAKIAVMIADRVCFEMLPFEADSVFVYFKTLLQQVAQHEDTSLFASLKASRVEPNVALIYRSFSRIAIYYLAAAAQSHVDAGNVLSGPGGGSVASPSTSSVPASAISQLMGPSSSHAEVLQVVDMILDSRAVLFHEQNVDGEFVACLCFHLYRFVLDDDTQIRERSLQVWRVLLEARSATMQELLTYKSGGESKSIYTAGFDALLTQESTHYFSSWLTDNLEMVQRVLDDSIGRTWRQFSMSDKRARQEAVAALHQRRTDKQRKREKQEEKEAARLMFASTDRAITIAGMQEDENLKARKQRQTDANMQAFIEGLWERTFDNLVRQRAVWGPPDPEPELGWMLDFTEGPSRMRRKTRCTRQLPIRYPPFHAEERHVFGDEPPAVPGGGLSAGTESSVVLSRSATRERAATGSLSPHVRVREMGASVASALQGDAGAAAGEGEGEGPTSSESDPSAAVGGGKDKRRLRRPMSEDAAPPSEYEDDFGVLDEAEARQRRESSATGGGGGGDGDGDRDGENSRRSRGDGAGDEDDEDDDVDEDFVAVDAQDALDGGEAEDQEARDVLWQMLEPGDEVEFKVNCARVAGMDNCWGVLIIASRNIYLIDNYRFTGEGDLVERSDDDEGDALMMGGRDGRVGHQGGEKSHEVRQLAHESLREVHKRRYLLRPVAVELFFSDGQSYLLVFDIAVRDQVTTKLQGLVSAIPDATTGTGGDSQPFMTKRSLMLQRWQSGQLSNFQYLMHLNTLAGRSYNDLTQYPVFPWVLSDYESEELDLSDPSVYRDLSKPMGALTEPRAEEFRARFDSWEDPEDGVPKFHYGTHYSSAGIVLYYMIRMEPFTRHFVKLQGGRFDHPDRLFHSMRDTWKSASQSAMSDVKELIPEFFYLPEFLENRNEFDYGEKQTGEKLGNVILPPWAKGDVNLFIRKHREALESEYVSAHLHLWIDLIFGSKQRDKAAEEAQNVFYYLTYEGAVDIESIDDPIRKAATIAQINNFGQTPAQLFRRPHPKRFAGTPVATTVVFPSPRMLSATAVKDIGERVSEVHVLDGRVVVSGKNRLLLPPHHNKFVGWGFFDLSARLIVADGDKAVHVQDQFHDAQVTCMCASEDGKVLVSGGQDSLVIVRRFGTPKQKTFGYPRHLCGHDAPITCLAVSTAYSLVVSGSEDKTVIIWDLNRLSFVAQLRHAYPITAVAVSNNGGLIVTCAGPSIHVWTVNGEPLGGTCFSTARDDHITSCMITSDKEWLESPFFITGHRGGYIWFWALEAASQSRNPVSASFAIGAQADGKQHVDTRLPRCSLSVRARLWNHKTAVTALAVVGEGKKGVLYSGDEIGRVLSWVCPAVEEG